MKKKLKKCLDHGIKVGVIWCQDWQGKRMMYSSSRLFWNWIYDDELYPNLPSYIKSLNEKGIRFMGYINSFLAGDGVLFKEAEKKGYTIKNQEGGVYHVKTGMKPFTTMVDLSNPEAIDWLKGVVKKHMIDIGLSGWMADFGEYLPVDAVLHSGEDPEIFHNKYPTIWAKTMYEAIKEAGKLGEIVFFNRSGNSYTSKYSTLVWAGDQLVDWSMDDGLASVIPAGISLGICGIGYFHSDTGGYSTFFKFKRKPELFKRWMDQSIFTMIIRTHEGNIPERNIQFDDDEVIDHFALTSKRHNHLKPYLKHLSKEYQEKGIPPIRACYLHYEDDPELHKLKYQYLFGEDLLVAPVIKPEIKNWEIYLPEDDWIHVWSGEKYQKGWHIIDAPIGQIPAFYRKDSQFCELFESLKKI